MSNIKRQVKASSQNNWICYLLRSVTSQIGM